MPDHRRRSVLLIILAAWAMVVIDASIVVTALPKIRDGLGFSTTGLSWVQNAYTLTFGGLLLLGARAGDILGRRRMFVTGLALFTATSLAVGVAQSPAWLVIARALQGAGAAVLAPSTLALLSTNFAEGKERTRAVAYYAAVAAVGASVGLLFGGIFTDLLSWRFAFFINLPIGIALIVAAQRHLPEAERHAGRFDLILGAMFGYFFFITQYLQGVKGYSPLQAGIAFLPMTLVNAAVAMAVPRLAQSFGNRRLLVGGITCSLIGMLCLSRLAQRPTHGLRSSFLNHARPSADYHGRRHNAAGCAPCKRGARPSNSFSRSVPGRYSRCMRPRFCSTGTTPSTNSAKVAGMVA